MTARVFSPSAVAALFLERQHLARPRSRRLTASSLVTFVEDVGGLQIDSINVVERGHHLTLWSRFGPYGRGALERIVYRRRLLFEYWAHAACLVPASHYPAWRRAMLDYSLRSRAWGLWLQKNRRVLAAVEAAIASRGPLGSADFEHRRKGASGGWWDWKPATHALDYLWMSGRTLVHSRTHFRKRFDLAERVMPEAGAVEALTRDDFQSWHLRRSLHALGAASEADLRMYLTFPRTTASDRARALREALDRGEVVEVEVEGERDRWLALAEDLASLEAAGRRRRASAGTTLLSPFDSFLWHRDRVRRLFGYDYKLEVYTPGHARSHGYYSLPILHDGHLVGRLDPKVHRQEGRLEVKAVHFEPWFAKGVAPPAASWGAVDRDATLAGIGEALRSLARFVGAEDVTVGRVTPRSLSPALRRVVSIARALPRPAMLPSGRPLRPAGQRRASRAESANA
ncbi:MAG TPA: crosslink repair DNA glycosylase YcaQ family protein [Vicinamibacteria bacterium]|nr:crosslink repair DNA glycosylase YcaQ family protein [Vicinamibacteria bacterium]